MQIYDKKQNFLKNITQQKPLPANIRKENKKIATDYRFQYRGTNSVGQPYE